MYNKRREKYLKRNLRGFVDVMWWFNCFGQSIFIYILYSYSLCFSIKYDLCFMDADIYALDKMWECSKFNINGHSTLPKSFSFILWILFEIYMLQIAEYQCYKW